MAVMTKWLVVFHNGVHKSLLGFDEAHIRQKYPNVKSVFKMGIKHNTTQEKENE